MTYFRMRKPHTIIGAGMFHFWVRDGVRWFQTAMVARKTVFQGNSKKDFVASLVLLTWTGKSWGNYTWFILLFKWFLLGFSTQPTYCSACLLTVPLAYARGSVSSRASLASSFVGWAAKPNTTLQSDSDYMVKTISQLVHVSFTHYCASTPCLSTS